MMHHLEHLIDIDLFFSIVLCNKTNVFLKGSIESYTILTFIIQFC
jgi:hypothetical protein